MITTNAHDEHQMEVLVDEAFAVVDPAGARLATEVREALRAAWYVSADGVEIEVRDHAVYLSGTVDWEHQRVAAVRAVEHLEGVHVLRNGIRVRPRVEASEVRATILSSLSHHDGADEPDIVVDVDDESVTLMGTVSSYLEFQTAQKVALAVPHVRSVRNDLRIVRP
jgi:osmotically-inducible protein OsmY